MSNFQFVQAQNFSLAGAGAIAGATTVILKDFKAIDGITNLVMADFGLLGFATIEPGNGTQEEQISFTGVTQNANGTATLTGVKTVLFLSPYTASSGLAKTHPGSATLVISNTSGFYDQFAIKDNDETITGDWTFSGQVTFDIAPISPITNPLATTAIYGISRLSYAPVSALDPITVSTNDPRVPVAYAVDAVGTDAYAITPSPAITAYAAGQHFTFKVGAANTGPATLAVNGLAATPILKNATYPLQTGDLLLNQVVEVVYDGANMQLESRTNPLAPVVNTYDAAGSPHTWTKNPGLLYIDVEIWGGGGGGGGNNAGAGGGGSYNKLRIYASSLGGTETVTIGAGGTGGASDADGVAGGNSTFGSLLTGYGGGRGGGANNGSGGGGAGMSAVGGNASTTTAGAGGGPNGGAAGSSGGGGDSYGGGGGGGDGGTGTATGGKSIWGGGGGAGGGGDAVPGSSIYGGGGGGVQTAAGGGSIYGGAGGTNSVGAVPGGGGSGGLSGAGVGKAGGAGRCVVTEYYQ